MNAIKILPQLFPSITEAPPGSNFPFSPGNEIQATVLRIVDSRHVLLQLQNRQILAEANAALPAGETLRLIVEETRPNVILRLLDPGNAPGNLLPLLLKKGLAGYFSAGREGSIPLLAKRPEGGGPVLLHPKLEPLLHFLKETALGSRFGEMREALQGSLSRLPGVKPYPSAANFILCDLKGSRLSASEVREGAARRGVLIRDGSNFPCLGAGHIRVAVRLPEENRRLVDTLDDVLGS